MDSRPQLRLERSPFVPHFERTTKGSSFVVPAKRGTSGDGLFSQGMRLKLVAFGARL